MFCFCLISLFLSLPNFFRLSSCPFSTEHWAWSPWPPLCPSGCFRFYNLPNVRSLTGLLLMKDPDTEGRGDIHATMLWRVAVSCQTDFCLYSWVMAATVRLVTLSTYMSPVLGFVRSSAVCLFICSDRTEIRLDTIYTLFL